MNDFDGLRWIAILFLAEVVVITLRSVNIIRWPWLVVIGLPYLGLLIAGCVFFLIDKRKR